MHGVWTRSSLAKVIDHTILKAVATESQIISLCAEARAKGFASVCVNPWWVSLCAHELEGAIPLVCTVIGFPLGANAAETKVEETRLAVRQGAREIDMVINIGALKSGERATVEGEICAVVAAAGPALVKVIIETCYLTDDEKRIACELSELAGAHFVKTSTGFGTGGATVEDVRLMRSVVGDRLGVKASGGIKGYADAVAMLEAGASRLGLSSGLTVLAEAPE